MTDINRDPTNRSSFAENSHVHRRVSWAAIFGGVVVVIATQILLSLLGAGIGLGTINVNAGDTPTATSFGVGAGLWWLVSTFIALFAGGYASAWLAGSEMKFDGILQGLVAWSVVTMVTIYLLSSAIGGIIGGGFSTLSSVASSAGSGLKSAATPIANSVGISPDMLQQQAQAYLKPTNADVGAMSPRDAQKEVAQNLYTYQQGGAGADAAKNRVIEISAAQMKISRDEASKKFDDAQARLKQTMDQARQKAADTADATATGASRTAFGAFLSLLLGALAAGLGGAFAVRHRSESEPRFFATRKVTT